MTATAELFFDLSSPWTYLAFNNLPPIIAETGARLRLRPFLVGGVFNAVNPRVYAMRNDPDQTAMNRSFGWLREWARLAGLPLNFPSPYHPVKSVLAMRCCCALEHDQSALTRFAAAAFDAYFAQARNIDDPEVLAAVAEGLGMDGSALIAQAGQQPAKDRLRANTDEAIARGAFGSPTIIVGETHLYFGNDQLPLVRQRLIELAATATES